MALINLENLGSTLLEFESSRQAHGLGLSHAAIHFNDINEMSEERLEATRFSIRIPRRVIGEGVRMQQIFRQIRQAFSPDDQCIVMNDGDNGILIEGKANVRHKALIALWELGIYHFQATCNYALASKA